MTKHVDIRQVERTIAMPEGVILEAPVAKEPAEFDGWKTYVVATSDLQAAMLIRTARGLWS